MYLGIDIGTSAVKAVLMDADGAIHTQASTDLSVSSPHPNWSEQNPDDWWRAVCASVGALFNHYDGSGEVRAIGLSGQMHGAVCLDADRQSVRPAILWNDGRAHGQCDAMLAAMPEIGTLAGINPMPGFTAPKLLWLQQNEPETHARIRHILLPKDYVRLRMTGTLATDMADAAGTLWLDEASRRWSDALCGVSAVDPAWLPTLHEGNEVTGTLTDEAAALLGLPAGIPVAAGGGDAAAGAIGIGAVEEGDSFLSLGTSGQLFVVNESYRPSPTTAIHAFAHAVPERWFQMAAMLNGASPLKWWAETVDVPIPALLTEAEGARQVPFFLPYLSGERTPHNDPHIRGCFFGLSQSTSRAEMTQAVLDAIAYTFCDANAALAAAGTVLSKCAAIGGGAQGDRLLQTICDATGLPLRRYEDAQAGPALGAARLAQIAVGDGTIADVVTQPRVEKDFQPDPLETERHAARLVKFRALYQALKPLAADT